LADERRAARIAVLVGGGRVEVGGWSPEAGSGQLKVRATGAGAGARAAVQRTRKDRVAQLDLLDDDRAHARGPGASCAWPWCWRRWRILAQVLELAL